MVSHKGNKLQSLTAITQQNNALRETTHLLGRRKTENELTLFLPLGEVVVLEFGPLPGNAMNVQTAVDWSEIDQLFDVILCSAPIPSSTAATTCAVRNLGGLN